MTPQQSLADDSGRAPGSRPRRLKLHRGNSIDQLPLTLSHRRIYVLPTRRGWTFCAGLLIMLVTSINYDLNLGYALSFLLTGLFSSSLLMTFKTLSGTTIAAIGAGDAIAGDPALFRVTLKNADNETRTGLEIRAKDALGKTVEQRFSIEPDQSVVVELILRSQSRGYLRPGRFMITTTHPVGLWRAWSWIESSAAALILPRPEALPPPLPVTWTDDRLSRSRTPTQSAQQGEFAGLREYVAGDSPSQIAWKSAARGLGLHTRVYEQNRQSQDTRLRWSDTPDSAGTEARISRLTAWVKRLAADDASYSVELPGAQLQSGHGEAHHRQALKLLALHEPDAGGSGAFSA